jgi:peroxin-13
MRLAEEQSRTAFQSVESIVQAFSSVSMMLESTLNAIYSSFRAVFGVADQFSRLKLQLSQILTTLAVVRFLRWLWRRFLIFLRLRPSSGNADELWRQMMGGDTAPTAAQILSAHGAGKNVSHWPTLVFFTFVLGGPYLIWKVVSKLAASVEDQKRWATGERSHFLAVALYDFEAGSAGELSVRAGQRLRLAPKELQPSVRGWILGSADGKEVGLVPANYIKILGKQNVEESPTSLQPAANSIPTEKLQPNADFSTANLEKLFEESENKSM